MTEFKYYYEDMEPGREFAYAPRQVKPQEIIDFALEFDPQDMHLSEEAGRQSVLGGLAASGWHSCAMMMRMMCESLLKDAASEGAPGIDKAEWRRPVLAGDTLSGQSRVVEKRPLKSRPGIGLVHMRHEIFNQKGELVLSVESPNMFRMRAEGTVATP